MTGSVLTNTDQSGAHAAGDMVGRDKIENHFHAAAPAPGVVEKLLERLQHEMESNKQVKETIEALAYFKVRHSADGVDGLEAKLAIAGRSDERLLAIEKKEMFAKLLERWSLYASAQEIFAYLLARAEYEFDFYIRPCLGISSKLQVNQLFGERIIEPTVEMCGSSVFTLNHSVVTGMVYWLAEQCFIRWHP